MKYCITSRGDIDSETLKNEMTMKLSNSTLVFDEEEPDLVISIGGDGTLLSAFHHYVHRLDKTAFIGVHTGHLGFYADWTPEEIDKLIDCITNTPYQIFSIIAVKARCRQILQRLYLRVEYLGTLDHF